MEGMIGTETQFGKNTSRSGRPHSDYDCVGMVENFLVARPDRYSMETIGKPMSDSRIARGQPDGVGCDARRAQASDD